MLIKNFKSFKYSELFEIILLFLIHSKKLQTALNLKFKWARR